MKKRDHYETLGVKKDADQDTIKKAYRNRAKETHPDVGGGHEEFLAIERAYRTLGDDGRRQRYDQTGADADELTPEQQAMQILAGLIVHAVESAPMVESIDILEVIGENIEKEIESQKKQAKDLRDKAKKFSAAGKRIKIKKAHNFLATSLEAAAAAVNHQAEGVDKLSETGRMMLRLLKEFSYEKRAATHDEALAAFETLFGDNAKQPAGGYRRRGANSSP